MKMNIEESLPQTDAADQVNIELKQKIQCVVSELTLQNQQNRNRSTGSGRKQDAHDRTDEDGNIVIKMEELFQQSDGSQPRLDS